MFWLKHRPHHTSYLNMKTYGFLLFHFLSADDTLNWAIVVSAPFCWWIYGNPIIKLINKEIWTVERGIDTLTGVELIQVVLKNTKKNKEAKLREFAAKSIEIQDYYTGVMMKSSED